jgi:hypothetical protein
MRLDEILTDAVQALLNSSNPPGNRRIRHRTDRADFEQEPTSGLPQAPLPSISQIEEE